MNSNKKRLILASTSPRRRKLLAESDIEFTAVDPRDVAEDIIPDEDPAALVIRHAIAKAQSVAGDYPDALVIGADTIVFVDGEIMGKPQDEEEAAAMLAQIAGRSHFVYSGIAVIDTADGREEAAYQRTKVHFKRLSPDEITRYVATGEPMDKAGAYAIQGKGAFVVDRIEGDYFNVVGLPMCLLGRVLAGFGYDVL
ncbi:MAG: septum formation inhibitor Maf [bacterium]|nr:septum formation inhibitor Maf [bacterium]